MRVHCLLPLLLVLLPPPARAVIRLVGSGLERIEAASTDAGEITGAPDSESWSGEIPSKPGSPKVRAFRSF